jgi:hypothetical protein
LFRRGKRVSPRTLSAKLLLQPLEDRITPTIFIVTNTNDSGAGRLRAAINNADHAVGALIDFAIPGSGVQTINIKSPLPAMVEPMTINGFSQGASPGYPLIQLNGSSAGSSTDGLVDVVGSSLIEGLTIDNYGGDGIIMEGSGSIVRGCFIGTNATGTTAAPNKGSGIYIWGSGNRIGSTTTGMGNVISGNAVAGIYIQSLSGAQNTIVGNDIGTDPTSSFAIGNKYGIEIRNKANENIIGGVSSTSGNVISGNTADGILLQDPGVVGNLIEGNSIGDDLNHTIAIPNNDGVAVSTGASGNQIGSTPLLGANDIAGNSFAGIDLTSTSTKTIVLNNTIGANLHTTLAIPNEYGIVIDGSSTSNVIGGVASGDRNIISGNSVDGIDLFGPSVSGNLLEGNYIGTNLTATSAVPNGAGIVLESGVKNAVIGGSVISDGNVISGNTDYGIEISDSSTTGNKVENNFIGTSAAGTASVGNGEGVLIDLSATKNIIGGSGVGNVIGGNGTGVDIENADTTGNLVEGNEIGLNKSNTPIANSNGVVIGSGATQNTVGGGTNVKFMNFISGNTNDGVDITGSGTNKNTVAGNSIGTNIGQSVVVANGSGVVVEAGASSNIIGGTVADAGNLISGNGTGVLIQDQGTTLNSVEFDDIGTDFTGTVAIPNGVGISILNGAYNNTIGAPKAGNIISGNSAVAIEIFGDNTSGNLVQDDSIGTDISGETALANTAGIQISFGATNNTITSNIISGNTQFGVEIALPWTSGNMVEKNMVGLDKTGGKAIANGVGVVLTGGANYNTIGGINAGNDISGNSADGVVIQGSGTSFNNVEGNLIGIPILDGTIGNGNDGVLITNGASYNTIGGIQIGEGNLIDYNGGDGVFIGGLPGDEASHSTGDGNAVLSNSINGNAGLGIDLGTSSDTLTAPTLSSATLALNQLTLSGIINAPTNEDFRVEVFVSPSTANGGDNEGQILVGAFTVQTGGTTSINFSQSLNTAQLQTPIASGQVITITITDQYGNTSEFSAGETIS